MVVTNINDGTFSYFALLHNGNEFVVHDSFHMSLSIFQINISPDPGNDDLLGLSCGDFPRGSQI